MFEPAAKGFAGALEVIWRAERLILNEYSVSFTRDHSAFLFIIAFFDNGKAKLYQSTLHYGRFLRINNASTTRPTMITTNNPTIAGTKYVSATDFVMGDLRRRRAQ